VPKRRAKGRGDRVVREFIMATDRAIAGLEELRRAREALSRQIARERALEGLKLTDDTREDADEPGQQQTPPEATPGGHADAPPAQPPPAA
jgi:hypothetical protein